ncbi:MAG: autotransporter domain-containing protein [Thermoguttaceae bacterium]
MRALSWLIGVFFLIISIAASARAGYPDGYSQDFINAMNWAMGSGGPDYTPNADGMVNNLKTLTHDTPGLIWKPDDPSRLLLSTFCDYAGYHQGYVDKRNSYLWLAAAPDLYNFLRNNNISGTDAALRTNQLLGMPANTTNDRVVEVWASVNGLERPMKNPDVTKANSSITYPYSPEEMELKYPGFMAWFAKQKSTYTANPPYPWTQLGYTCDWGNPDSRVGLTEFVLPNPTAPQYVLNFYAVYSIGSYAYVNRDTGNFNITGDCDTVWAGTYFQPYNSGNSVVVASGATVYQGIWIYSGGYTVTNNGTVLGPGKNLDKTYRPSVMEFQAGGTLVNTGTIDGLVGVDGSGGAMVINNSGLIRGTQCAIRTSNSADRISNSGTIDGNIETGGGGDTVIINGGTVNGNITDGTITSTPTSTTISGGGTGAFIVNAASGQTAVINGDVRNFASMTIHSGTAKINGQMYGDVTVESAGTLGGNTTIKGGNLVNQGAVAPGNSIGVITLDRNGVSGKGAYTQQSGATLDIELSKPMDGLMVCDRIDASGDVTLAAGSKIEVSKTGDNNAAFRNGDRFNIITTSGNITYQGVQVASHSSFLTFTTYKNDPASITKILYLNVLKSTTFASVEPEGNSKNLAAALDSDGDIAINSFANVVNDLLFMNSAEFSSAVPVLTPAAYQAVNASERRTTQYLAESMSEYLQSRHRYIGGSQAMQSSGVTPLTQTGNSFTDESPDKVNILMSRPLEEAPMPSVVRNQQPDDRRQIFARPFGIFFDEQTDGDHLGFHAGSTGVQVALDRAATDDFIYGWSAAYARTSIRFTDDKGAGDINNLRVGPYLSRSYDDWFFDGSATYGYHDDNVTRDVTVGTISGTPNGKYNAHDFSLFMAAGCERNWCDYTVTPLVSLQYIFYHQNDFTESGGNGTDLTLLNNDSHSLRSKIGMQLYRTWQIRGVRLVPDYSVGWAHEYLGDNSIRARFAGGTTVFDTDPAGVFRDSMYFGAGLAFLPTERTSLFFRYNGEWASGGQFNAVNLGLAWEY